MKICCFIPARGGSKGIVKKNIIDFLGKPLLAHSIEHALHSKHDIDVYVSSDCDEILSTAKKYGAKIIKRPLELSSDICSSESALLHAIETVEKNEEFEICLFLQATSPLRESLDIDNVIDKLINENLDSVFSGSILEDFLIWELDEAGNLNGVNFDFKNRKRRQDNKNVQFVENGSIYAFRKESFKKSKNRIHGKFSIALMENWKNFEIDSIEDYELCKIIHKAKFK